MTGLTEGFEGVRTRIVLVRHADHVTDGDNSDPGLTELGMTQADRLAARLARTGEIRDCSRVCTSTLLRARRTAEILQMGGGMGAAPLEVDEALAELPWSPADVAHLEPEGAKDSRPSKHAESWNEFEGRVRSALRAYGHVPGTTVLVCHTGIIEVSFLEYGRLNRRSQRFAMAPRNVSITTWARLDRENGEKWRLERYNDCQHLWDDGFLRHRAEDYASHEALWAVLEPD